MLDELEALLENTETSSAQRGDGYKIDDDAKLMPALCYDRGGLKGTLAKPDGQENHADAS